MNEQLSPPLYARVLRLRQLRPSRLLCLLFFEGMITLGVLLALAELASWWTVVVLPIVVAGMVKLNDVVAGAVAARARLPVPAADRPAADQPAADRDSPGSGPAPPRQPRQASREVADALDPTDSLRQRFRQSARRRYR